MQDLFWDLCFIQYWGNLKPGFRKPYTDFPIEITLQLTCKIALPPIFGHLSLLAKTYFSFKHH